MDLLFKTFEEASAWAREVPGRSFSPNSGCDGFVGRAKTTISSQNYSELDPESVKKQLQRISKAFFTSMGYRKVGTADRGKILRYLLPLTVEQLFMLRAAVELESKSSDESHEADLSDGRQART